MALWNRKSLRTDEGAYVNLVDEYVGPNCVNPSIVHMQGE